MLSAVKELLSFRKELIKALSAFLTEQREAEQEAMLILCDLTRRSPAQILAGGRFALSKTDENRLAGLLQRRRDGVPLAYLLGRTDFYGRRFSVGEGVLIPRQDTECLAEEAIRFLSAVAPEKQEKKLLDLCAGSGCVGITVALECPNTTAVLLEKEAAALPYLQKNAAVLAKERCTVIQADLLTAPVSAQTYDLITANPPYIRKDVLPGLQREVQREPVTALNGGADGLFFYRAIAGRWIAALVPGGGLFLEIGFDQGDAVAALLTAAGLQDVRIIQDENRRDRVVRGVRK